MSEETHIEPEVVNEIGNEMRPCVKRVDDEVPRETCSVGETDIEDDTNVRIRNINSEASSSELLDNETVGINDALNSKYKSDTAVLEMPKSTSQMEALVILHPDTTLIDETQIDPVIEVLSDYGIFGKERHAFPLLMDPGIDGATYDSTVPAKKWDEVGIERYKNICKDTGAAPIGRLMHALTTTCMDLRNYGVNSRGMRAVAEALSLNRNVKTLDLEGNLLTRDAAYHLGEMLRENNTITRLNLAGCMIGAKGAANLKEGLMLTQCLKELDISRNQLRDDGFQVLSPAIVENCTITYLNLSNNELGLGTSFLLGPTMEENWGIVHLDLSHNFLYSKDGVKTLFIGMAKNKSVATLKMAWNALSTKSAGRSIQYYLLNSDVIQHLDLSWNRLDDPAINMIKNGASKNQTLLTLKIGNNPLSPDAANLFLKAFINSPCPLKEVDMENIWVNKDFLKTQTSVQKVRNLIIKIGGVLSNYATKGPDVKQLLFARANFEAQKPKSKRKKKDFGHFILKLENEMIKRDKFEALFKNEKLEVNENLIKELMKNFAGPNKRVNLITMKEYYLKLYPGTTFPLQRKDMMKDKKGNKTKLEDVYPEISPSAVTRRKSLPSLPQTASKKNLQAASQLL